MFFQLYPLLACALWNKLLPNITQNNMYALTMNYAPYPVFIPSYWPDQPPLFNSIAVKVLAERG